MTRLTARLFLLAVVALTACIPAADYEDVSRAVPYERLIGERFRTRHDLVILGITNDRNYQPPIEYYVITGTPSFSGPEVLDRNLLAADSVVEVTRVLRCRNCPFEVKFEIEVTISPGDAYRDKPVFISSVGNLLELGADKAIILSSEYFEPIPN